MGSEMTRFYAAEIFLAVNFLHKNNIIHRDLKPDNVMFDKLGHMKLLDFGVSKLDFTLRDQTSTFVGTPGYIAPEILKTMSGDCSGYGMSADWWSYGVIVFEVCQIMHS